MVEGLDYEAIYILDSSSFGHGDFGRFTFTLNGTYLSRFELQISPDSRRFGLSGSYVFLPTLTGSLPHTRAFASAFWDGPAHTWLAGFDIGATVHYTGQYEDNNMLLTGSLKPTEPRSGPFLPSGNFAQFPEQGARKIREWTTLDLIASYTFNLPPPAKTGVPGLAKNGGKNVMTNGEEKNILPAVTAEYNPCGSRSLVKSNDDYPRDTERVRFRSALRRRRLRVWLRRITCQCQRPILLYPAKEKILTSRNTLDRYGIAALTRFAPIIGAEAKPISLK